MTTHKSTPLSGVDPPESRPGIGDVAKDVDTGRVGVVMGQLGGRVQMRPVSGGIEWDAMPERVTALRAREELSARLAVRNGNSRSGL
ncbi:hypothetical protein ABZ070_07130 [Streptomyces sp. NPDC006283]|uniref:hypothetical protein n=1 Tax=Streptomyces sp. NPDC006283 TaxID=3156741 RepID=UPI0033BD3B0B